MIQIEIDLSKLERVWIPKTSKRIGHWRKIKGVKKDKIGNKHKSELSEKLINIKKYEISCKQTNKWIKDNPDRYEDVATVNDYSVGEFEYINFYLRTGKLILHPTIHGRTVSEDEMIYESNHISSFLNNAPKFEGIVYRGMHFETETEIGNDRFNCFIKNMVESKEITCKSFTSTSIDIDIAKEAISMGSRLGYGNIIFEIKSKNGVPIGDASAFLSEREVLFDKNSKFHVIDINELRDNTYIKLEEI